MKEKSSLQLAMNRCQQVFVTDGHDSETFEKKLNFEKNLLINAAVWSFKKKSGLSQKI